MTRGNETHMGVMLQCMKYLTCTKDAGLLLKPTRKWDEGNKLKFRIRGRLDSDNAKDAHTRQSVTGYVVCSRDTPEHDTEDSSTITMQSRVECGSVMHTGCLD
jgi:hypothetical protein